MCITINTFKRKLINDGHKWIQIYPILCLIDKFERLCPNTALHSTNSKTHSRYDSWPKA